MTQATPIVHQDGDVIDVPLNKLKKSPRNARRTPHAEADIETLAASIAAKGVLQAPVVEPEADVAELLALGQLAHGAGLSGPWGPVLPLYPTSPVEGL